MKSLYSLGIFPSISSMLLLLLLIFNSSFLHTSSSRLTNSTFFSFFIVSSFVSSSIIFSSSFLGMYIFLYYCQQFCRLIEESFQSMDRLCFYNQLYPGNKSWFLRFVTDSWINSWWLPMVMFILTTSVILLSLFVEPLAL